MNDSSHVAYQVSKLRSGQTMSAVTLQSWHRMCEQNKQDGVVAHRNVPPPQLWQVHMYRTCLTGLTALLEEGIANVVKIVGEE